MLFFSLKKNYCKRSNRRQRSCAGRSVNNAKSSKRWSRIVKMRLESRSLTMKPMRLSPNLKFLQSNLIRSNSSNSPGQILSSSNHSRQSKKKPKPREIYRTFWEGRRRRNLRYLIFLVHFWLRTSPSEKTPGQVIFLLCRYASSPYFG